MSAEVLREAAGRLDELAGAVDTSECYVPNSALALTWADQIEMIVKQPDAAYIAAMSPTVGKALAALLLGAAVRWQGVYEAVQRPSGGVDDPPGKFYGDPEGAGRAADAHVRREVVIARAILGDAA